MNNVIVAFFKLLSRYSLGRLREIELNLPVKGTTKEGHNGASWIQVGRAAALLGVSVMSNCVEFNLRGVGG
jgi:hypothetical protein